MSIRDALVADRHGEIEKAAIAYEEGLRWREEDVTRTVNLIVLYWQATDYGFSSAHHLAPSFVARAGARLSQLIKAAVQNYPDSSEVSFWKKYIAWVDLGEPFDLAECQLSLELHPDYLEPAMMVFSATCGAEAEDHALELLKRCREDGTTRSRYVASVIEGVLKRKTFRASK